jgi:hypothetical protein
MCVYCDTLLTAKPTRSLSGLDVVVTAITNRNTRFALNSQKERNANYIHDAFANGLENSSMAESYYDVGRFLDQPRHLVTFCVTSDQLSFLEQLGNEFFSGSVGHAAGWILAKGLSTTNPLEDGSPETSSNATELADGVTNRWSRDINWSKW